MGGDKARVRPSREMRLAELQRKIQAKKADDDWAKRAMLRYQAINYIVPWVGVLHFFKVCVWAVWVFFLKGECRNRHVCRVEQQTWLQCDTADMLLYLYHIYHII